MPGSVTVFLKHPAGLHLRLHKWEEIDRPTHADPTAKIRIAVPTGDVVILNGTAAPYGQARQDREGNFVLIVGGYAATSGVDKDFWDRWLEQNKDLDIIRNRLLYAHEKPVEAQAWARDHTTTRSGLEQLVPTLADGAGKILQTDPRAPRGVVRADKAA